MYQVDFNHPIHVYFYRHRRYQHVRPRRNSLSEGLYRIRLRLNRSALTEHLEKSGAHVNYGKPQKAENITDDIDLVVYTAAVHADNQEFSRAKECSFPCCPERISRTADEKLRHADRCQRHQGKTTTTSMISEILLQANTDRPFLSAAF